jgi:Skp family chaperone for outer membrane proteins
VFRIMKSGALFCATAVLGFGMTAEAAPAPQPGFGGPVLAGICVLNQQAVFNVSKVGIAANGHYKQLHDKAQTDVNAEEVKIVADAKALQNQKLAPAQLQQKQQQVAKRYQDLRARAAKESQDLETTRQNVVSKIAATAQPIIYQVYNQRKCGILVARSSVLATNPAMDMTAAVVAGLDAKITTIAFDVTSAGKH